MVKAVELSLCKVGDLNNRLPMSYALWWTRLLQSAFDSLADGMQEMWKGCLVRSLMRLATTRKAFDGSCRCQGKGQTVDEQDCGTVVL